MDCHVPRSPSFLTQKKTFVWGQGVGKCPSIHRVLFQGTGGSSPRTFLSNKVPATAEEGGIAELLNR